MEYDFGDTRGNACMVLGGGSWNLSAGGNASCAPYYNYPTTTEDYLNPFDVPYIRATFIALYSVVFACCFLGNLMVIIVVLRHRKMRTITNFFLANLAAADLCVGIFCVLPNLSLNLSPQWILGRVMCKLYYFVQAMSYTASVSVLTVISLERYAAIVYPLRSRRLRGSRALRVGLVLLVWLVAATCGLPFLLAYDVIRIEAPEGQLAFCLLLGHIATKVYATASFVLEYAAPLVLMMAVYFHIGVVLWRSSAATYLSRAPGAQVRTTASSMSGVSTSSSYTTSSLRLTGKPERRWHYQRVGHTASAEEPHSRLVRPNKCKYSSENEKRVADGYPSISCSLTDESTEKKETKGNDVKHPESRTIPNVDFPHTKKKSRLGNGVSLKRPLGSSANLNSGLNNSKSVKSKNLVDEHKNSNSIVAGRTASSGPSDSALIARRKVIRLLIAVIVSFAICVLPYHLRVLWQVWGSPGLSFTERLLPPITFLVYYFNSGLNPILYAFLSDNFRQCLREVLRCSPRPLLKGQASPRPLRTATLDTRI